MSKAPPATLRVHFSIYIIRNTCSIRAWIFHLHISAVYCLFAETKWHKECTLQPDWVTAVPNGLACDTHSRSSRIHIRWEGVNFGFLCQTHQPLVGVVGRKDATATQGSLHWLHLRNFDMTWLYVFYARANAPAKMHSRLKWPEVREPRAHN